VDGLVPYVASFLAAARGQRQAKAGRAAARQRGLGRFQSADKPTETCSTDRSVTSAAPSVRRRRKPAGSISVLCVACALALHCPGDLEAQSQTGRSGNSGLIALDPHFHELVPPDARLEEIADGFAWVEGPVWNQQGGYLLFSDIPNNAIYKWEPAKGTSVFLMPSGYTGERPFNGREPGSNGLTFDAAGRLVLAQHGDRRIARLEAGGEKTTLVDRYRGKRLNSPNDLVYNSEGDLYFTDPPFGLPLTFEDPARELDFSGVYRLSSDGELTLLIDDLKAPNGVALSPDENTLYVTDVDPDRPAWHAYDIKQDGTLANGRVFFDAHSWVAAKPGSPDGLKVDTHGNVFAAGPGGVYLFAPDGTLLGRIETGVATSNCAWGEDGSALFIAAGQAIYRIKLRTKGAGF
jgi:gluconolactonase